MKRRHVGVSKLFLAGEVLGCLLLVAQVNVARAQTEAVSAVIGLPDDWTHHHVLFPDSLSPEVREALQRDPRYWLHQARRKGEALVGPAWSREIPLRGDRSKKKKTTTKVDWSVSLGKPIAAGMYPAKFTFNVNAAPSCSDDYVVFALNGAGSSSQANVVGLTNLYTNPGGTGFCLGTGPTVQWAYNVGSGPMRTSPVLSLDGTKVAFVEHKNPPVFHVLTPDLSGNAGCPGATPCNGTDATHPAVPGTHNSAVDVRISYGATGDSSSPPWVDYVNDVAYVGADDGKLYKITGVFLGTPTLAGAPWPLTVSTTGKVLTGPVLDSVTNRIFIGDSRGVLRFVRLSASDQCTGAITPPCVDSTTISTGTGGHELNHAPIVDSTRGRVFVFQRDNGQGDFTVTQADTTLGSVVIANISSNQSAPAWIGAFDHGYRTGGPGSGHLYACGTTAAGSNPALYQLSFNMDTTMNPVPSGGPTQIGFTGGKGCSPLTAFFNPNVTDVLHPTGTDFLFVSVQGGCTAFDNNGCIKSFDITNGFPIGVLVSPVDEVGGTSGIIVDNVSTVSQGSSIYFSTQATPTGASAVKLTQSGLQ